MPAGSDQSVAAPLDASDDMTTGRPWTPVPLARGRTARSSRRTTSRRRPGSAILRAGGTRGRRGDRDERRPGVVMPSGCGIGGDAFWLIWDERHGPAGRPQRLGPRAGRRRRGALRATRPDRAPAPRAAGDHGPGRGPLVGRRPRPLRPAVARRDPGAGDRAGARRVPGLGRVHRRRSSDGRAIVAGATSGPAPGSSRSTGPHGRPWRPGERVRLPALAATLETPAPRRLRRLLRRRPRRAAGTRPRRGRRPDHARRPARPHVDLDRADRDRLPRRPGHDPPAEQLRARRARDPGHPGPVRGAAAGAFGPDGVTDPAWIHLGIEAAKLAMADRDAYLTDPAFRDVPVERLLDPAHAAELAARIDPRRAARPAPATQPARRRHDLPRVVDARGNAVSLIQSNYLGLRVRRRRPRDRHPLPEPGQLLQPRPGPSQRPRAGQADAPHAAPRDAVPRRSGAARGSSPGRWAATPSRRSTPSSCRPSSTAGSDVGPRSRRRAGSSSRTATSRRRSRSASSRATRRASPRRSRRWATRSRCAEPFDSGLGHEHAIELVDGGPARRTGRWRPRPTRAARGCRRSGERPPALRADACAILRAAGGGLRSHDAATGLPSAASRGGARDLERRPELPVHQRDRGRARRRASRRSSRSAPAWPTSSRRRPRRSTTTSAGGSGSARPRAARASSTRRATRSRSTPSSSSATGPARRPSCAERASGGGRSDHDGARRRAGGGLVADGDRDRRLGDRVRVRLRAGRARGRLLARRGDGDERRSSSPAPPSSRPSATSPAACRGPGSSC